MPVQAIPEGYSGLMPFLAVDNAAEAIEFYARALGARERMRMPGPPGKIAHCELEIGGSVVIVADLLPGATSKPIEEMSGDYPQAAEDARRDERRRLPFR